ncbi:hypothetical protein MPSEU_001019500 [Mayamaea pseudoterrestris]|nr:hypothetical protein MPSEU_001019500 [Mayamaea pseudoterrestris]
MQHGILLRLILSMALLMPLSTALLILKSPKRRVVAVISRHSKLYSSSRSAAAQTTTSLPPVPSNSHRVVFMRHGESEFNNANIFTGWCDIGLTRRGVCEAIEAGQVLYSHRMTFDKCYSSLLTRSIVTAQRALEAAGISYTPIHMDWRINERHYGALQGLSKERTADRLGRNIVMEWRRSFEARPPDMTVKHPHYDIIHKDARYNKLQEQIPLSESLHDCQERVVNAWTDIQADIRNASPDEPPTSFVVAHANSLRALVMSLDGIGAHDIENLNIPTAIPFYYDICKQTGNVLSKQAPGQFRGIYIADERKKRSFLERRRASNDPWLWALHDDQVDKSMLLNPEADDATSVDAMNVDGMDGVEEEAKHNTEIFGASLIAGERTNR